MIHDFDHVVRTNVDTMNEHGGQVIWKAAETKPDWVREPPDDYNTDTDPGYDEITSRVNVPMLVVIGETIHAWDDKLGDFVKLPYRLFDGKIRGDDG